jgi:quinol monooxygenase YgiN
MQSRGLRLFAFMRYGPMKDNREGILDLAAAFAARFRGSPGCVYLPLIRKSP